MLVIVKCLIEFGHPLLSQQTDLSYQTCDTASRKSTPREPGYVDLIPVIIVVAQETISLANIFNKPNAHSALSKTL